MEKSTEGKEKKQKFREVRTKHLVVRSMSNEEVEELIKEEKNPGFKAFFKNVLSIIEKDPDKREWYAPKILLTRKTKVRVGVVGFLGEAENYGVEVYFRRREDRDGEYYADEALEAIADSAFKNENIYYVKASCNASEEDLKTFFERKKYEKLAGSDGASELYGDENRLYYEKEKPSANWISVYMCFGVAIGVSMGQIMDIGMGVGVAIGIAVGTVIGYELDKKEKKNYQEIREKRRANHR